MYKLRARAFRVGLSLALLIVGSCGGGGSYTGGIGGGSSSSSSGTPLNPGSSAALTLTDVFPNLTFTSPLAMLQAPNDNTRWFVVEQGGRVRVFQNSASASTSSSFIDISSKVATGSEMGLLGMAFHPNFPAIPRVFLSYTASINGQIVSRIAAFTSSDGGATLNANSEQILMTVNQPEANHKGGSIVFGPDGFLYIGFGDGGGSGDQHTNNGPNGNAQSTTTLLGKILRIDVDTGSPYAIPNGNPYNTAPLCGTSIAGGSGSTNCPEIYAYGFRNPWRFSFDRVGGELWAGDVGQGAWEEIDRVIVNGNYGWRYREGAHCYNPATNCPTAGLIDPVAEYSHALGISVTGGYVYRGTQSAAVPGRYFYADYGSGRIWALNTTTSQSTEMLDSSYNISSFGQGNDGELYVVDYSGGHVYRLTFSG
jgi:glucose/arabinose dehydrogenase